MDKIEKNFEKIEEKLRKSFSNIKEDISVLKDSMEKSMQSSQKEMQDLKEEMKNEHKKDNPEIERLERNIIDLTKYLQKIKEDISELKENQNKPSEVKSLIEFNELKSQISDLKYSIENIKFPKQEDNSKELFWLIKQLTAEFSGLKREVESIKRAPKAIQKDYSPDIEYLAGEIGKLKGSLINKKYLDKELGRAKESIAEKLSEIEYKQRELKNSVERRARQPLIFSLKNEVKQLKIQIDDETQKYENILSEIKKENLRLRKESEENQDELKREIANLKGRITRLSKAPEKKEEIITRKELSYGAKNRFYSFLKFLAIIIPILLVGYVFYANFVAAHDFNYFYDIGSEQDAKKPYLSPANRISDVFQTENASYRNLTSQIVYFDVPIPPGSDNISVQIKVRDNFPENYGISLGARDNETWHYDYKSIYNPILSKLPDYPYSGNETRIYRINNKLPLISNISEIPDNSIVVTNLDINAPANNQAYDIKDLTIKTGLRGGHIFYVYLKDSLNLKVKKQDLNWYNGSDELAINLYDLDGSLIENTTIEDDGIATINRSIAKIQYGELKIEGLKEGIYKLEFQNFDGLIKEISLNTNKIVTNQLFLADSDIYINNTEKTSQIYTRAENDSYVDFDTYHTKAFQDVMINNKNVTINSTDDVIYYLKNGNYTIKSDKNDVIITSPSYLSFSKDSYFEPFRYSVIGIPQNLTAISKNVDYLITDYSSVQKDGDWLIGKASFSLKDLYVKDGKLSMLFNVPHLSENKNETNINYVPIDWINVTVHKDGFFEKNRV